MKLASSRAFGLCLKPETRCRCVRMGLVASLGHRGARVRLLLLAPQARECKPASTSK